MTTEALCGAHRRGKIKKSLVTEPPAGAGSSCLEKQPGPGSCPHTCWKKPDSQVLCPVCWPMVGLVFEMIPPGQGSSLQRNLAVQRAQQMEGWGAHRAVPSQAPHPWCTLGLLNMHGATDCNQCVALSKATQDMLQTP